MVGNNIRRLRLEREWTQEELADRLGLSRQAPRKLRKGETGAGDRYVDPSGRYIRCNGGRTCRQEIIWPGSIRIPGLFHFVIVFEP